MASPYSTRPLTYTSPSYGEPQPLPRQAQQPLASSSSYPYPPQHQALDDRNELENDREDLLAEDEKDEKLVDWAKMFSWKMWLRRKWIPYYFGLVVCAVLVVFMSIYHKEIMKWLQRPAQWMKNLPAGFLIPVGILFVISWPPLFGHEVVAILCGVVWPIWEAFGIVCFGTFLGEMGNFIGFRYCLRGTAEKFEKSDLMYACMAKVVRDGGLPVALVARYSAIPGHFTTAVFSTVGMNVWCFIIGVVASFPKQLITVYLGTVLNDTTADSKSKWISNSVLAVSFLITVWAAWWIWHRMQQVRPGVLAERRRLARLKLSSRSSYPAFSSTVTLQAKSEVDLMPAKDTYQTTNDLPYNQTDTYSAAETGNADPYSHSSRHPDRQPTNSSSYTYSNPQPYRTQSPLPQASNVHTSQNQRYESSSSQPASASDRFNPHLTPRHPSNPSNNPARTPSPHLPHAHQAPSAYALDRAPSPSQPIYSQQQQQRGPMPAFSARQPDSISVNTASAAPPYTYMEDEELTPTSDRPIGHGGNGAVIGLTDGDGTEAWRRHR